MTFTWSTPKLNILGEGCFGELGLSRYEFDRACRNALYKMELMLVRLVSMSERKMVSLLPYPELRGIGWNGL